MPQGSALAQHSCTALGECAHLSLPGHMAMHGYTCVGPCVHVCGPMCTPRGKSSEELQVNGTSQVLSLF